MRKYLAKKNAILVYVTRIFQITQFSSTQRETPRSFVYLVVQQRVDLFGGEDFIGDVL